jgi:D-alanyl-D-alanine carboxypeptidase
MLRSGNDAALAIAHYVGGSVDDFVKLMNEKANKIGMKNTTFNNPSGLDEKKGNYSTAYDMAILTSYAMKNEEYRKIVGTKKYRVETNKNVYSWTNKNKLLSSYKYTTGGKTGYTKIAKRTLVTTASKNNLNLVVVTLNDGNDWQDHENLFEEAFETYKNYKILQKGLIDIYDEKYYKNSEFYLKNSFSYPLLDIEKNNIVLKIKINKVTKYKDNEKIGDIEVYISDKKVYKDNVYIKSKDIKEKSFIDKLKGWLNIND